MRTGTGPSRRLPATLARRAVLALSTFVAALAGAAPANGIIYGIKSLAPQSGDSAPPTHLFTFLENGSGFTDVGAVKLGGADIDADGLAFNRQYGLLAFNLAGGGSTLISINPATAVATQVGSLLSGRNIRGAAFDSLGTLWALDAAANQLLTISPTTGAVLTAVGLTLGGSAYDLSSITDIAQRPDTGALYLVDWRESPPAPARGTRFYTVDPATGALTELYYDGALPLQAQAGAAFSLFAPPDHLFTYDINGPDDIYRYDVDPSFSRTTLYANIIPSFNAGRGDLAAEPVPEPLTAAGVLMGAGCLAGYLRRRRAAQVKV